LIANQAATARIAEAAFDAFAGNRVIAALSRGRSRKHLRILAYHGVDDPEIFRSQMEHVARHYKPVSVDQILESLDGPPLPRRAVWVTFDDGYPSVVEDGLSITEHLGIPITLFICPGVIDTSNPFWWQAVAQAREGDADSTVRLLKSRPDRERRQAVRELTAAASGAVPPWQRQLTSELLAELEGTSATIGNHTWDHPTLDTCEPIEQEVQIGRAHEFLRGRRQFRPVIAYPNGNWTPQAEAIADRLGYRLGLLFDHRLTDTNAPRLRWSRLRVSSDTPIGRFTAILSGAHPRFHVRREALRARFPRRLP
jgi:peptidoglycan/xylan/chitin deacetylase (PgdA/CDA1 family)